MVLQRTINPSISTLFQSDVFLFLVGLDRQQAIPCAASPCTILVRDGGWSSLREKNEIRRLLLRPGNVWTSAANGSLADLSAIDVAWLVFNDARRGIAVSLVPTHVDS
jgi:hypothetical protein